jgi:hypothetical protein
MKQASQEIAHDPARMRAAEREDFAPQGKTSCARASRNADAKRARRLKKNEGLER